MRDWLDDRIMTSTEMIARLAAALMAGGAIGLERERQNRPAGLRTHLLVALASSVFMLISVHFVTHQRIAADGLLRADVTRIAAGVVMGMGFLGAGAIGRGRALTHGLTTAASLWLTTALGLAAGAGMYVLAAVTTVLALFVLVVLRAFEPKKTHRVRRRLRIILDERGPTRPDLIARVRANGAVVRGLAFDRRRNRSRIELDVRLADGDAIEPMLAMLEALPGVIGVTLRLQDH
jgi:putative Mg2+ transporter-C (MgtC) family protein